MLRDSPVIRPWAAEIILSLSAGPKRFNWLLEDIKGISDRLLSCRLRELEEAGLAKREVDPGPPVRVYYRLSSHAGPYIVPLQLLFAVDTEQLQEAAIG